MLTYTIVLVLVAAMGFMLGNAYERSRCEVAAIAAFEEAEDARVFNDPVLNEAFGLNRPHLKIVHDADVDAHFDRLVRAGLIEPT